MSQQHTPQTKVRFMVPGLRHDNARMSDGDFLAAIDAAGGWPLGYRYVGFVHSDEREAGFCNSPYNDGWWTVLYSADDYYLWKLSPECLQRVIDAVRSSIRIPAIDAGALYIKNSRGYRAAIAKTQGAAA